MEFIQSIQNVLFGAFYVVAIAVVILHYTGWLAERGIEWIVYVVAVLVLPVALSPLYL